MPSMAGEAEVEDRRGRSRRRGPGRSPSDRRRDDRRRETLGAQPLLEEGHDTRLVLGDQDPGHPSVLALVVDGLRRAGSTVNVAPAPGVLASPTRPPCASAIASTIARPSPAPSGRRRLAAARRSARRCARGRRARCPGPCRGWRARSRRPPAGRRTPMLVAVAGVLHRVVGEVQHGLGDALPVDAQPCPRGGARAPSRASPSVGRLRERARRCSSSTSTGGEAEEVRLLRLREKEQVVDEAAHAVELVGDELDGLAALLRDRRRSARGGRGRS